MDNLIEFAKEQCTIFPEDSEMGKYLRETLKMLQAEPCEDVVSREDVIKTVDRHTFDADDGLCLDEDISIILEEVAPKQEPTLEKVITNKIKAQEKYEKDLNDLKEQILKDGDTLVSKRDLLERFCEMDKEYNSEPWNLLQILSNINILVGEEPSEDAMSRQAVLDMASTIQTDDYSGNEILEVIDVDDIKSLPLVIPTQKEGMQDSVLDKIKAEIEALPKTYPFVNHIDMYVKEDDVKRIIDKYRAESEK